MRFWLSIFETKINFSGKCFIPAFWIKTVDTYASLFIARIESISHLVRIWQKGCLLTLYVYLTMMISPSCFRLYRRSQVRAHTASLHGGVRTSTSITATPTTTASTRSSHFSDRTFLSSWSSVRLRRDLSIFKWHVKDWWTRICRQKGFDTVLCWCRWPLVCKIFSELKKVFKRSRNSQSFG